MSFFFTPKSSLRVGNSEETTRKSVKNIQKYTNPELQRFLEHIDKHFTVRKWHEIKLDTFWGELTNVLHS